MFWLVKHCIVCINIFNVLQYGVIIIIKLGLNLYIKSLLPILPITLIEIVTSLKAEFKQVYKIQCSLLSAINVKITLVSPQKQFFPHFAEKMGEIFVQVYVFCYQ